MNRLTLAASAAVLLLAIPSGLANLPVTAAPAECGSGDLSIVNTVLSFSSDFALENPCGILVDGALVGTSGASVRLRSDGPILILGTIAAGDGDALHPDGGSVVVEAGVAETCLGVLCSATSVLVGPSAVVKAGDGAPGAPGAFDTECRCVLGGDGGDGGIVRLIAQHGEAINRGVVQAGAGGDGGAAQAMGAEPVALGGAGGSAGNAIIASPATATVVEAPAGIGGDAIATTMSDPTSEPLDYLTGLIKGAPGADQTAPACETTTIFDTLNAYSPVPVGGPAGGDDGSDDANRSAVGGNGSAGPDGGDGGNAVANGCDRTNEQAGNGTDGRDGGCVKDPDTGQNVCQNGYDNVTGDGQPGQQGKPGVKGGSGIAEGGHGGPGLLVGGKGGSATATGGQGGTGGTGGRGGDASEAGPCLHGGNGGQGGPGGPGGDSVERGGQGGNAYFAAPVGQGGPGGEPGPGHAGPGGIGGDGGEGGQGSWDGSFEGGLFNAGCGSDDGLRGPPGPPGGKGTEAWANGERGSAGNMSLQDWLKDETGVDVNGTAQECTEPVGPYVPLSQMSSNLGCRDAYFALLSLVAAVERVVQSCGVPIDGLQDGAGDADGGDLPVMGDVDCGALLDELRALQAEVEQEVADAVAVVAACLSGHDPSNNVETNACSLAYLCVQDVISCSGAKNILAGCDDDPEACSGGDGNGTNAGVDVDDIVQAVEGLVPGILATCEANHCQELVTGIVAAVVGLIPSNVGVCEGDECETLVADALALVLGFVPSNTDVCDGDCQAFVVATALGLVPDHVGTCDADECQALVTEAVEKVLGLVPHNIGGCDDECQAFVDDAAGTVDRTCDSRAQAAQQREQVPGSKCIEKLSGLSLPLVTKVLLILRPYTRIEIDLDSVNL